MSDMYICILSTSPSSSHLKLHTLWHVPWDSNIRTRCVQGVQLFHGRYLHPGQGIVVICTCPSLQALLCTTSPAPFTFPVSANTTYVPSVFPTFVTSLSFPLSAHLSTPPTGSCNRSGTVREVVKKAPPPPPPSSLWEAKEQIGAWVSIFSNLLPYFYSHYLQCVAHISGCIRSMCVCPCMFLLNN